MILALYIIIIALQNYHILYESFEKHYIYIKTLFETCGVLILLPFNL